MNRDNYLLCFAGLPASGKTTFASIIKESIERHQPQFKVKIIDPDIIRNSINSGKFDPVRNNMFDKIIWMKLKMLLLRDSLLSVMI